MNMCDVAMFLSI